MDIKYMTNIHAKNQSKTRNFSIHVLHDNISVYKIHCTFTCAAVIEFV